MPQPSINFINMQSRNLSYYTRYLYFIMQYIKITYTKQNITIKVIKIILRVIERDNMLKKINENFKLNKEWKEKNKKYIKELQNFFDKADNITDTDLKRIIINQMLKCDDILTQIAELRFEEFYKLGYKHEKKE